MALTLTPGQEMRLGGAPDQLIPYSQDRIQAIAARLVEDDEEGVLYGGDIRNAIPNATQIVIEEDRARMAGSMAGAEATAAATSRARQAAQGVVPEDLPADEYGSVSARTVRDANMSPEDQEASLNQFQGLVDAEIRDLREGRFHGANAQARQYEQDYGLPTAPSKTGKTDLDYLREIQQHQGFLRTGRGEMIPMGPTPTPEAIASRRDFDEWGNETPGSERQARYFPAEYEEFREEARNRIRERAQQDMATYGTGPTWRLEEQANDALETAQAAEVGEFLGSLSGSPQNMLQGRWVGTDLARLNPGNTSEAGRQLEARQERTASEDRVADAEREVRIARLARSAGVSRAEARAMMDAQRGAMQGDGPPLGPLTVAQRRQETQGLRDLAGTRRDADLAARQALVAQRGELRGDGLPYSVGNMRNRFDDLIARLGDERTTDWQRAGIIAGLTPNAETANPTPLGRDAVGAQNAMRWFTADALAGNLPGAGEARQAAVDAAVAQLPLNVRADRERDANDGVLSANSAAGQDVLAEIATQVVGSSYATNAEVRLAIDRAKAEGIPEQDAIEYFRRHSQFANSGFWGFLLGPNDFEGPSAAPAPPAAPPPPGRQGDVGFR